MEALSGLQQIETDGQSERKRFYDLQIQVATRLLERQESTQLAKLLLRMQPSNLQEKSAHMKLVFQNIDQLITKGNFEQCIDLLSRIDAPGEADKNKLFLKRIDLAQALLERGRLEELNNQVDILMLANARDPRPHLLRGHLNFSSNTINIRVPGQAERRTA